MLQGSNHEKSPSNATTTGQDGDATITVILNENALRSGASRICALLFEQGHEIGDSNDLDLDQIRAEDGFPAGATCNFLSPQGVQRE
jgi:hypothetical protein